MSTKTKRKVKNAVDNLLDPEVVLEAFKQRSKANLKGSKPMFETDNEIDINDSLSVELFDEPDNLSDHRVQFYWEDWSSLDKDDDSVDFDDVPYYVFFLTIDEARALRDWMNKVIK